MHSGNFFGIPRSSDIGRSLENVLGKFGERGPRSVRLLVSAYVSAGLLKNFFKCGFGQHRANGCRVALGSTGFLQLRENWKKSGNLSGQGKVRGKYFF